MAGRPRNAPHHAAWRLLAYTGARRGELLELRWRDWDAETATLKIRRSAGVIRNAGEGAAVEVGLTKTERDRTITVDPGTAALLKSWKRDRGVLGLHLVRPDSLIFSDLEGQHLHPERFSRTWNETVALDGGAATVHFIFSPSLLLEMSSTVVGGTCSLGLSSVGQSLK